MSFGKRGRVGECADGPARATYLTLVTRNPRASASLHTAEPMLRAGWAAKRGSLREPGAVAMWTHR